jgi:hypothetical protein
MKRAFVLGPLLIVKDGWMLVKTITAFPVAHSITLAIATFGYADAPLLPLNAAIALGAFWTIQRTAILFGGKA